MTTEEFCDRVEMVIEMAREEGLSDDDMIAELEGIIASIKGE